MALKNCCLKKYSNSFLRVFAGSQVSFQATCFVYLNIHFSILDHYNIIGMIRITIVVVANS